MDTIDPAQVFEQKMIDTQKEMNELLDLGDSPVQQFYHGTTVLVTGSSGFIGKQLVEKLFRSCQLKKMYILLRSKKGKTMQQRLNYMLKDPLYDVLRKKQPDFADKIIPIEGDISEIKLGLSEMNWTRLTKEVDTIFHLAATIRFDMALKLAVLINVRGTRETLELARNCANFKNYVYVSTAFSHATYEHIEKPVLEQFYPSPVPPHTMIELAEALDQKKLDDLTENFIKGWPNTYTFTKAIAEELIRTCDLPACVVRPPIVVPAHKEPPGWLDMNAISGPCGIFTGILLGVLHVFYVNSKCKLAMTPVDLVNNATIAAGWDAAELRKRGEKVPPVYTVSNKDSFITWDLIGKRWRNEGMKTPSPKAVWYCYMIEVNSKILYWILSFFLHYIPAYIMDIVCGALGKMPKGISSFVGIFRTIDKFTLIFEYFLSNEWGFVDDNVQAMISRMSNADKAIYNCDIKSIDFNESIMMWGMGVRKYIIKDGLEGSCAAYKKQMKLKWANYGLIGFVGIFRTIDKFTLIFEYFLSNEWGFVDDNVQAMISRMSNADKAIYNCDIKSIDFNESIMMWGMGVRKYIIKDGLEGSCAAYKKQMKLKWANYGLIGFYLFVVLSFLYIFCNILCKVF